MDETTAEQWREVPGFPAYKVSDRGRVWSLGEYHRRPKMLKPRVAWGGYPRVVLYDEDRSGQTLRVYKIVAMAFLGPCPPGMVVRHLDGDPLNSRASNLRYGTPAENEADKAAHGRNWQTNKTHYPQGHPYDERNTQRNGKGRRCRECHRVREHARYHGRRYASDGA